MRKLWVEELDDKLINLISDFAVSELYDGTAFHRYERFGKLDMLLSTAVPAVKDSFFYSWLTPKRRELTNQILKELTEARTKLTDLDHALIDLCYGSTLEDWLEAVIVSDYPSQQDKSPNEVNVQLLKAHITPERVLLDGYLRTRDGALLDQLIEGFQKLPLLGSTIDVRVSREKLDQQIELVWLQAAIKELH
jgi:hypothetical protein